MRRKVNGFWRFDMYLYVLYMYGCEFLCIWQLETIMHNGYLHKNSAGINKPARARMQMFDHLFVSFASMCLVELEVPQWIVD